MTTTETAVTLTSWRSGPARQALVDFVTAVEEAEADPSLSGRQPWKAAVERDHHWLGALMAEHYAGDDTNVRVLAGGILAAYAGISVEDFEAGADAFLRSAQHPT